MLQRDVVESFIRHRRNREGTGSVHSDYQRYAIAWVPQIGTPLARFGKSWTGWCEDDPETNAPWPRRTEMGFSGKHWDVALRGLHGTLSQPFRLAPGRSYWRLDDALQAAARSIPAIPMLGFDLSVRDDRLVLLPRHVPGAVERLQGRVADAIHLVATRPGRPVEYSGTAADLALGMVAGMPTTPSFTIPLTDQMPGAKARDMVAMMRPRIAGVVSIPHALCDLALMADPGRGRRWRLLERYRLAEARLDARKRVPECLSCPDQRELPPLETVLGSDWDTVIT